MRGHKKCWPALVVPLTALNSPCLGILVLPDIIFLNKISANVPNNMPIKAPLRSFELP